MSWAEDNGIDNSLMAEEIAMDRARHSYYVERGLWEDRFGNVHVISKMRTRHLKCCLSKIKRENWRTEYIQVITDELNKRKDDC